MTIQAKPLWTALLMAFLLVPTRALGTDSAPSSAAVSTPGKLAETITEPPVATILERVAERWRSEDQNKAAFLARYAFTHRQITEKWDSDGTLKEREEESRRHAPVEADKRRRLERRTPGYKAGDFRDTEALIQRFDFHLERRETVNDRVSWVLRFQPKDPPVPARNLKERFVNAVAGRVWVDVEEHVPVKMEMRLLHEVGVIGGLVGNVRHCEVRFDRRRTPEGLWFTPTFSWRLQGRTLFASKNMTHQEEKFDLARQPD
jgi:hypothetical protein